MGAAWSENKMKEMIRNYYKFFILVISLIVALYLFSFGKNSLINEIISFTVLYIIFYSIFFYFFGKNKRGKKLK